jgi:hypothetical protein
MHIFHKWKEWTTVKSNKIETASPLFGVTWHVTGVVETQRRTCEHCGKAELRLVKAEL